MPEPRTLDEKVDALRIDVAVIIERLDKVNDHETRLRSLEKTKWYLAGAAALGGYILSQILPNLQIGG
jgi:hypothetical protein